MCCRVGTGWRFSPNNYFLRLRENSPTNLSSNLSEGDDLRLMTDLRIMDSAHSGSDWSSRFARFSKR